jgi:hypothetical protein
MDAGGRAMQEQLSRTRSFQCTEFKQLFFLRGLRAFVVNAFAFVLKTASGDWEPAKSV